VTELENVPGLRLRVNSEQFWASFSKTIESRNGGDMSPDSDGKNYDLYFFPPQEAIGSPSDGLLFSYDLMNFDPSDAANGDLILDSVKVETFPLP
jgi:hypothetical protein